MEGLVNKFHQQSRAPNKSNEKKKKFFEHSNTTYLDLPPWGVPGVEEEEEIEERCWLEDVVLVVVVVVVPFFTNFFSFNFFNFFSFFTRGTFGFLGVEPPFVGEERGTKRRAKKNKKN